MHEVRQRFWVEFGLAIFAALLFVLTLITREWVEIIFRVDPDGGSGALEWALALGVGTVAVASGVVAWLEYRRPTLTPA
jgi:hypothetical protein